MLGAVQVISKGRPALRARRRERLLLGLLALEANRSLSVARLEQLLWTGGAPRNPRQAIQVYISRLRAQLGEDPIRLTHQGDGYALRVDPDFVDAHRFVKQVAAARSLRDPTQRAERLGEALAMWRGLLLEDAADDDLRERIGRELEETRLSAVEMRVEAELDAGRHESLVGELARLTETHPYRERLISVRMKALYRCGRVPEALEVYRESAAALEEAVGLDFSDELKALYVAILRHDKSLAPAAEPAEPAPAPAQLPPDLAVFVGREAELERLIAYAPTGDEPRRGRAAVCAVDGMAGVGKTALATRAAHHLADRFPDGRLYVNLHGFTRGTSPVSPEDALDRMMRALGMPPQTIPRHIDDRAAAWRSLLAGKKTLIVLDNAAGEDQVLPLLPAASGCLVLITSRVRLSGLDDVSYLSLSPLTLAESAELFGQIAGPDRVEGAAAEAADEIGRLCGRLPLAVRIAAARLRDQNQWTVRSLAERLRDSDSRLSELSAGHRGVASALELSYRHLDQPAQRMFRLLGLAPAMPIDDHVAAALADVTADDAASLLAVLVAARVLDSAGGGRYQFHDLTRHHAVDMAARDETGASRHEAIGRVMDHYAAAVNVAACRLEPERTVLETDPDAPGVAAIADRAAALAWLDDTRHQLRAAVARGHDAGFHRQVYEICRLSTNYYEMRCHHDDWLATHQYGLSSARKLKDDKAQARMLIRMGGIHAVLDDFDQTLRHYEEASALCEKTGDVFAQAAISNNLGKMYATGASRCDEATAFAHAQDHLTQAYELYCRLCDATGQAKSLANLGGMYAKHGRHDEALVHLDKARAMFRQLDRAGGEGVALYLAGTVHARRGDCDSAIQCHTRALELARQSGDFETELSCLEGLGNSHRELGQLDKARRRHQELRDALPSDYSGLNKCAIHNSIADTFQALGDAETARRHYRQAAGHALETGAGAEGIRP